ncbi:MAG: polysaccharide deacetylase family protein [Armatimonadetes bacterium]|nr:polysaccharide deacetylase family protein [Armatimonadota bacterium]
MNAWDEPDEPNPVAQIIAIRAAQVGGATSVILGMMALFLPPNVIGAAALVGGIVGTVGLSPYFLRTFHPRTRYGALPLWVRLSPPEDKAENHIALTFDDGPHPDTTPRLLDALATANARATFFVVAERAARYPALMRRIVAEGHAVGVHGLRHRTMVTQSAARIKAELHEAVSIIEKATGVPLPRPVLLRPPYGFRTATVSQVAHEEGFRCVAWSLDGRDYDAVSADDLAERIMARLQPGDIVLLHERPHAPTAAEALPRLLAAIREKEYAPVALRVGRVGDPAHQKLGETAERSENHENA